MFKKVYPFLSSNDCYEVASCNCSHVPDGKRFRSHSTSAQALYNTHVFTR